MQPGQSPQGHSFGKRGSVKLSRGPAPGEPPAPSGLLGSNSGALKWIGGSIAAIFLLGLITGGTGGSGLLGGLIGGLIGSKLANSLRGGSTVATPAAGTPTAAAHSTTVQRGGFGSTAGSSGSSSSTGG